MDPPTFQLHGWPDTPPPVRDYEMVARDKLWADYADHNPKRGQHYVVVSRNEPGDECIDVGDSDEWCDCHVLNRSDRHLVIELEHPRDCEECKPGDGRTPCPIIHQVAEVGFDDLEDYLQEGHTGRIPIVLYVSSGGGSWEWGEYEAYLMVDVEEASTPIDATQPFADELLHAKVIELTRSLIREAP